MKTKLFLMLLVVGQTFALTCISDDGYKINIDKEMSAVLTTPDDTYTVENVRGIGTQYFGKLDNSFVRSFSLNSSSGELKLWTNKNVVTTKMTCD